MVSAFRLIFSVEKTDMDMGDTKEAVHMSTPRPRDLVDTDMTNTDMAIAGEDIVVDIPINIALM